MRGGLTTEATIVVDIWTARLLPLTHGNICLDLPNEEVEELAIWVERKPKLRKFFLEGMSPANLKLVG